MKKVWIPLFLVLIFLLQALLMPKYMSVSPEGAMIREYYPNAGNHDVIFVGDCEVYENFSPVTLWEENGVSSYIWGSPQQTVWQSYYLMEDVFRRETPKVMVFNVLSMKYDTPKSTGSQSHREAYNRMTLDGMRWSSSKWKSIQASMTEEERQWEGALTYIFPILRYHDRWAELKWEDVHYAFRRDTLTHNGYLMQTGVKPMTDAHVSPPLTDYSFGANSWDYLDKMRTLCEKNGTELVLVKSSTLYPVWWPEWEEQIEDYAREFDLKYINFLEAEDEIGIDWTTDTYDTGLHLNVYGAEKASRWFGEILSRECGVPDRRNDPTLAALWTKKADAYYLERNQKEDTQ